MGTCGGQQQNLCVLVVPYSKRQLLQQLSVCFLEAPAWVTQEGDHKKFVSLCAFLLRCMLHVLHRKIISRPNVNRAAVTPSQNLQSVGIHIVRIRRRKTIQQ